MLGGSAGGGAKDGGMACAHGSATGGAHGGAGCGRPESGGAAGSPGGAGRRMASAACGLLGSRGIGGGMFCLEFGWSGPEPRAGQFFMIRPRRSGVFLGRPISAAYWSMPAPGAPGSVGFVIAMRGKGTMELAGMAAGEEADLLGPLGNAWADLLPPAGSLGGRPVALIGGGAGLAPLIALARSSFGGERREPGFGMAIHAGARTASQLAILEKAPFPPESRGGAVATEDGSMGRKGRIPDFLEPEKYAAVCACGPEPMLKAVALKCAAAGTPCLVSLERRMACGVGACLGCSVKAAGGMRRCCADGPIFRAEEVSFDE